MSTNVFPGGLFNENKSSEVMHNSLALGKSIGYVGLDPTQITTFSAVTVSIDPSAAINSIVWASLNFPNLL